MVNSWLPEPPIGHTFSTEINVIIPNDSDDEEQEDIIENGVEALITNNGYRLLSDTDNQDLNALDESDEDDLEINLHPSSENVDFVSNSENNNDASFELSDDVSLEHVDTTVSSTTRDISVDSDQVRAIMARITLPASATPSWAVTVTDSEWSNFLQHRIRLLQDRNE